MYKIIANTIEEMTEICSELVKKGINFEARNKDCYWVIECTGGY
jgi:hypothetical protein